MGFARAIKGGLQLADGQQPAARFHLQQGLELEGLEVVGVLVEQLAHLPLSSRAIVLIAPEFREHQPEARPLGVLVGQALEQGDRFGFAVQGDQQFQKPLLLRC